jgi:hypothetical protein
VRDLALATQKRTSGGERSDIDQGRWTLATLGWIVWVADRGPCHALTVRNVTMEEWGFLQQCRYLPHDRDTKYTESFRAIIKTGHVSALRLPAQSPNLNAPMRSAGCARPKKSACPS